MKRVSYAELPWTKLERDERISKSNLCTKSEGGGVTFWKVGKGGGFPAHGHTGVEYIYVVEGRVEFSGKALGAGDMLLTAAGERHAAQALEDSVILVFNERSNR